jgi:hypothetical protein
MSVDIKWETKKVKQSRYTLWRRLGGEEIQFLLIHDLGTRWGWVQRRAPAALLPPGKGPSVSIVQEAGHKRIEEKSFAPAGDRTPIACRPARSQTLHCLSYPGSTYMTIPVAISNKSKLLFAVITLSVHISSSFYSSSFQGLGYSLFQLTHSTFSMFFLSLDVLWVYISELVLLYFHLPSCLNDLSIFVYSSLFDAVLNWCVTRF